MKPKALTPNFFKVVVLLIIISSGVFFGGNVTLLAEEKGFDLSIPYDEGVKATEEGNYDKAIESFRKVLFVDGSNMRAQYKLAEAFQKKGDATGAFKEFKYFLKNIHDSKRIPEKEKQEMIKKAEEVVGQVKDKRKGLGLLSFFDINVLIITFMLTVAFIIRIFKHLGPLLNPPDKDEEALKSIYVERYWERQEEKLVTGIPFSLFTVIMFGILVFFYFLTFRIFQNIS